jgi:Holliday junction resolvase RusA-like endonuclease
VAPHPPVVEFFVAGTPQPKGSTRIVPTARGMRTTSANRKLFEWEGAIRGEALYVGCRRQRAFTGAARVHLTFHLTRPQRAPLGTPHTAKPDLDKLVRAVLDALVPSVLVDDKQVMALWATKEYADTPGVRIRVEPVPL